MNNYIETLKAIAKKFETLRVFIANAEVSNMEIPSYLNDRVICVPGDRIEVIKWFSYEGPTLINVIRGPNNRKVGSSHDGETCIFFSWVEEMGAPKELHKYMPWPSKSWDEIIEEESNRILSANVSSV